MERTRGDLAHRIDETGQLAPSDTQAILDAAQDFYTKQWAKPSGAEAR